ncbi:S ribonuclease [Pyrus ussuriensis x Pyrus communis]|uniref:S ribonuclease n=1 Tax=Pyrus ussuriensis x Pyrus communis TaxID=2448454 RepID=A0A5N5I4N9_9ROSA|nr:S ribonuclease [Pyrus ussuriensis x Pyrus communis]
MIDVIRPNDLIEKYKLHKVNSPPPNFNLSMVKEFYSNILSTFFESGGLVYVRGYDLSVYHRKAYADLLIPFIKGTSNNGNPTLESARILFAMLTHCDVPFSFLIFKSILSKSKRAGTHQRGSTIHLCLIT